MVRDPCQSGGVLRFSSGKADFMPRPLRAFVPPGVALMKHGELCFVLGISLSQSFFVTTFRFGQVGLASVMAQSQSLLMQAVKMPLIFLCGQPLEVGAIGARFLGAVMVSA